MPSWPPLLALSASCTLCLAACGDPAPAVPAMMASAGAAAGGSSGQTGGGSTPGGNAAVGGTGVSGAPAMACSTYMDESGWSLVVQISNRRQMPVYLGQDKANCEPAPWFQVEDGSRTLLPSLEGCHSSCQQLMQGGPTSCPQACAQPSTLALQPGETVKIPWDGRFAVPNSLPPQCLSPAAQGLATCVQAARIEAALFTFSARAGTSRECLAGSGGCSCSPNANGGCLAPASLIAGTIITTEYLVKLEPGETSPSGEPPFIGLVFQD